MEDNTRKAINEMPPGRDSGEVYYTTLKQEISRQPGWADIPRDGGGDIDLVDF